MIEFRVEGQPAPAGSKTAVPRGDGRLGVIDKAKGGEVWSILVAQRASEVMAGAAPLSGPLGLSLCFERVRPRGHYGAGRNADVVRPAMVDQLPTTKPDLLKLARRVEDALTGICYVDDALICEEQLVKVWGPKPAVVVRIWGLNGAVVVGRPPGTPVVDASPAF